MSTKNDTAPEPAPQPETRKASEHPAEAKAAMLEAMESSESLGIIQAAIGILENDGWKITRHLHKQWMATDAEYCAAITDRIITGDESKADMVQMAAFTQLPDESTITKFLMQHLIGIGAKEPKPAPPQQEPPSFQNLSTEELKAMLDKTSNGPRVA